MKMHLLKLGVMLSLSLYIRYLRVVKVKQQRPLTKADNAPLGLGSLVKWVTKLIRVMDYDHTIISKTLQGHHTK